MSGEGSLRERKKRATRLDLVAVATELFAERGFEATTIDDIAARAGYSRRTFFRYFASKEDVAFGDALERLAEFRGRLLVGAGGDGDPIAVLREALRRQALAFFGEPVDRASIELWFREPALSRRFVEISEEWEEAAAAFLARNRGTDPVTDVQARVIATAMCGVVKAALRAGLPGPEAAATAVDEGFAVVEGGLASRLAP